MVFENREIAWNLVDTNVCFRRILLKNSDFGQNRKIFPSTELEENFGEGLG